MRETLEGTVVTGTLGGRIAHLRGRLRLQSSGADSWRSRLRERNWRESRRWLVDPGPLVALLDAETRRTS